MNGRMVSLASSLGLDVSALAEEHRMYKGYGSLMPQSIPKTFFGFLKREIQKLNVRKCTICEEWEKVSDLTDTSIIMNGIETQLGRICSCCKKGVMNSD